MTPHDTRRAPPPPLPDGTDLELALLAWCGATAAELRAAHARAVRRARRRARRHTPAPDATGDGAPDAVSAPQGDQTRTEGQDVG